LRYYKSLFFTAKTAVNTRWSLRETRRKPGQLYGNQELEVAVNRPSQCDLCGWSMSKPTFPLSDDLIDPPMLGQSGAETTALARQRGREHDAGCQ
jgi:hypothetical protein